MSRCLDPLKAFSGGVCGSKHVFGRLGQPSILRGELLVAGKVYFGRFQCHGTFSSFPHDQTEKKNMAFVGRRGPSRGGTKGGVSP